MNIQEAYNTWAEQYDTNQNKTRDLEAISLRETLGNLKFENCLEIGCGTGKNTQWLLQKSKAIIAVDFSAEMLAKAKEKITQSQVKFIQADITQPWKFGNNNYDLITFSLVLEHIENLNPIFQEAVQALKPGGYIYVGELHPFKQYSGSKARFNTEHGQQEVTCFMHHISDFTQAAKNNGLNLVEIKEYFDGGDRSSIPRILTLLLQKI